MSASKLYGIIYMSPLKLKLNIINLKNQEIVETASSAVFVQEKNKSAIYRHELKNIVSTLEGFLQLLKDYGVSDYGFWANQQLVDDVSARYLSDQIYVRTKLSVQWLNTSQITYYKTIATMSGSNSFGKLIKDTVYMMNIGSATITISKFRHGKFQTAWNLAVGYQELDDITKELRNTAGNPNEVIKDYVDSKFEFLQPEFSKVKEPDADDVHVIVQDSMVLNKLMDAEEDASMLQRISLKDFETFADEAVGAPDQFISQRLGIDERLVNRIVPDIMLVRKILKFSGANDLILTPVSVADGIAVQVGQKYGCIRQDFNEIILTSAENMARRYLTDDHHRKATVNFALHLFDQLKKLHRLGSRERLLLQIAANLDDIGNFINSHGHYRHSAYILQATKLIGLSDDENKVIADIARYHSVESPAFEQAHYRHIEGDSQMIVAKLAAILRMADALDDSGKQKISRISVSLKKETLVITASSPHNIALEKWAFKHKSELFEEVFGIKPVLKQRRSNNG